MDEQEALVASGPRSPNSYRMLSGARPGSRESAPAGILVSAGVRHRAVDAGTLLGVPPWRRVSVWLSYGLGCYRDGLVVDLPGADQYSAEQQGQESGHRDGGQACVPVRGRTGDRETHGSRRKRNLRDRC